MHSASENSQLNEVGGHGPPPSVVALVQTPVLKLHGPSPVPPGSSPPLQFHEACASKGRPMGLLTESQDSPCPISCCINTPPSRAAQGTWFCGEAVSYSGWNANGKPTQLRGLVSMNPLATLATMNPLCPVVRTATLAMNPAVVSFISTASLSPGFIFRVCAFG